MLNKKYLDLFNCAPAGAPQKDQPGRFCQARYYRPVVLLASVEQKRVDTSSIFSSVQPVKHTGIAENKEVLKCMQFSREDAKIASLFLLANTQDVLATFAEISVWIQKFMCRVDCVTASFKEATI